MKPVNPQPHEDSRAGTRLPWIMAIGCLLVVFILILRPGSREEPGTDLSRLQIVKGWLDAAGETHERVVDVAGGPTGGSVDPRTCQTRGAGHARL